jgi:hypothetical protein
MLTRMHRRSLSIAISALAAAVVAGLLVAGAGASAAPAKHAKPAKAGKAFRHVLAAKLGEQLDKPAGDVLAALKSAAKANRPAKGTKPTKEQRQARRKAWNDNVAKALNVETGAVDTAVQALVKERLDSLVADGWVTAARRDKMLANGRLGVRFLRVR